MKNIKNILKGIWTFVNSRIFLILLIVTLFIFLAGQCKRILDNQREISVRDQNISALTDSLKYEKRKNGELLVSIDGYIGTNKELKGLNLDLWNRVKGQEGTVISLTHTVIRLKQDSVQLAKHINKLETIIGELQHIDTNHYEAPWTLPYKYDQNNFFVVKGRTRIGVLKQNPLFLVHDTTYLTGFENQIDVTYGQKTEKGKLRIYIQSAYPGFSVKSMEGYLIDPNTNPFFKDMMSKKHWFTGFGTGPSISGGWNLMEAKSAMVVGWSFHYNIYVW
jgi:hypothetical protein